MNHSLQVMEKKFKSSQKEMNHTVQELEEKFKRFARETDEKSAGMIETSEKRLESEMGELDTKIKSLDISVHCVTSRKKTRESGITQE